MSRKPPAFKNHPTEFDDARSSEVVRGTCSHVVDGDTVDLLLDLGWYQYAYTAIRIRGIDAPETRGTTGAELERAQKALKMTTKICLGRPVLVRSFRQKRSFDRFIGDLFVTDLDPATSTAPILSVGGQDWWSVADVLLSAGLADPLNT